MHDPSNPAQCKLIVEHVYSFCAACGCDEGDMAACPKAQTKDEFHTGKEIERTEA